MDYDTKINQKKETCLNYTEVDFIHSSSSMHGEGLASAMDTLVFRESMVAAAAGAFNYEFEDVNTKVLAGKYGIVTQINVNRKKFRRKPDTILELVQPVNPSKFNFTKIQSKEVLFKLHFSVSKQEDGGDEGEEEQNKGSLEATMIINNAPVCPFHSLLVPFLEECWPQVLNHQSLLTAVHTILLSKSPDARIGFNSLGAFASVNHLHFHFFYLPYTLYVENAECERVAGPCYTFSNYFAPGFVFQLENGDVDKLVSSVMALVSLFLKEKVAHNLFITRGAPLDTAATPEGSYSTVRVMLWPKEFVGGAKSEDLFNVAAFELAGHVSVYSLERWETLSEKDLIPLITFACKVQYETLLSKVIKVFQ